VRNTYVIYLILGNRFFGSKMLKNNTLYYLIGAC
jgi:hypothetical protein